MAGVRPFVSDTKSIAKSIAQSKKRSAGEETLNTAIKKLCYEMTGSLDWKYSEAENKVALFLPEKAAKILFNYLALIFRVTVTPIGRKGKNGKFHLHREEMPVPKYGLHGELANHPTNKGIKGICFTVEKGADLYTTLLAISEDPALGAEKAELHNLMQRLQKQPVQEDITLRLCFKKGFIEIFCTEHQLREEIARQAFFCEKVISKDSGKVVRETWIPNLEIEKKLNQLSRKKIIEIQCDELEDQLLAKLNALLGPSECMYVKHRLTGLPFVQIKVAQNKLVEAYEILRSSGLSSVNTLSDSKTPGKLLIEKGYSYLVMDLANVYEVLIYGKNIRKAPVSDVKSDKDQHAQGKTLRR